MSTLSIQHQIGSFVLNFYEHAPVGARLEIWRLGGAATDWGGTRFQATVYAGNLKVGEGCDLLDVQLRDANFDIGGYEGARMGARLAAREADQ